MQIHLLLPSFLAILVHLHLVVDLIVDVKMPISSFVHWKLLDSFLFHSWFIFAPTSFN